MSEWVKVRKNLHDHYKVLLIAEDLGMEPELVAYKLIRVWYFADSNCTPENPTIKASPSLLDKIAACPGIAQAMAKQKWLKVTADSFTFPQFDKHMGKSAKVRATEQLKKARQRARNPGKQGDSKRQEEGPNLPGLGGTPVPDSAGHRRDICPAITGTSPGPEKRREEERREEEKREEEKKEEEGASAPWTPTSTHTVTHGDSPPRKHRQKKKDSEDPHEDVTELEPDLPPEIDTQEIRELWAYWARARKKRWKLPLTRRSAKTNINKLMRWGPVKSLRILEEAAEKVWKGLEDYEDGRPGREPRQLLSERQGYIKATDYSAAFLKKKSPLTPATDHLTPGQREAFFGDNPKVPVKDVRVIETPVLESKPAEVVQDRPRAPRPFSADPVPVPNKGPVGSLSGPPGPDYTAFLEGFLKKPTLSDPDSKA